jgi:hypothetical protein
MFTDLIPNSKLKVSQWYLITDWKTKLPISDTTQIFEGNPERFLVFALSENTLDSKMISVDFNSELAYINQTPLDFYSNLSLYGNTVDGFNENYITGYNERDITFNFNIEEIVDKSEDFSAYFEFYDPLNDIYDSEFYLDTRGDMWDVNNNLLTILKVYKYIYWEYTGIDEQEEGKEWVTSIISPSQLGFSEDLNDPNPDWGEFYIDDGVNQVNYGAHNYGIDWTLENGVLTDLTETMDFESEDLYIMIE